MASTLLRGVVRQTAPLLSRQGFNAVRAASFSSLIAAKAALTRPSTAAVPTASPKNLGLRYNQGKVQVSPNKIDPTLGHPPIDFLFIVGYGREQREKLTVPFVLANMEISKDPSRRIEIVLMFEGAVMALEGLSNLSVGYPYDTWDLGARIKMFLDRGGTVSVSTTCLMHRGLQDMKLMEGIETIELPELLAKQNAAVHSMQFW